MGDVDLYEYIKMNEGKWLELYKCPAGKWTIGYGRNIEDNGISQDEAELMLQNDLLACVKDLVKVFPDFINFDNTRKTALIDMRYNLGLTGFRKFKKLIAAVYADDWELAAKEALESEWAAQVGKRAERDAEMLRGVSNNDSTT